MGRLFGLVGATAVGYAGWFVGAMIGTATAFILSTVGSCLGVYYGRKLARYYS
jgi:hypothetical protein